MNEHLASSPDDNRFEKNLNFGACCRLEAFAFLVLLSQILPGNFSLQSVLNLPKHIVKCEQKIGKYYLSSKYLLEWWQIENQQSPVYDMK